MKSLHKSYFYLFDNRTSAFKYCLISWLFTTIPALVIMKMITLVFNISKDEKINAIHFNDLFSIIIVILIGPVLETFVIAFFIHWLRQIFENKFYIIISSTLLFAALHFRFEYPFWFFGVLWPSFTMSVAYLTWKPISFWKAYTICLVVHILNNSSAYLITKFF
jgi:hypothetical protein